MDVMMFVDGDYSLEVGKPGWLRTGGVEIRQVKQNWKVTPSLLSAFPDQFVILPDEGVAPVPEGATQTGWTAVPDGDGHALERVVDDTPVPEITARQLFLALAPLLPQTRNNTQEQTDAFFRAASLL